jgi:hypothetical protein
MIASVHLADLSLREAGRAARARPQPGDVPGLRWADLHGAARLGGPTLRKPVPGRMVLLAAWDDDAALDAWLARAPVARLLTRGWSARLEPLRAYGEWPAMPPMFSPEQPADDAEPVAVLTYGRPRLRVFHRFLMASVGAEERAVGDPALIAGTALARPRTVATFTVWRTAGEMRAYAQGSREHLAAMRGMRQHDFHHESIFARFRPYRAEGSWDGREPVAEAQAADATA